MTKILILLLLLAVVLYAIHLRGVVRETRWENNRIRRALEHAEARLENPQPAPVPPERPPERRSTPERSHDEQLFTDNPIMWDVLNGRR